MTEVVTWAASNGDRSENADYQYAKRRLRQIDGRIRHLSKRMEAAEVEDTSSSLNTTDLPNLRNGGKIRDPRCRPMQSLRATGSGASLVCSNTNIVITKTILITQRVPFSMQAEMLDAFNHSTWNIGDTGARMLPLVIVSVKEAGTALLKSAGTSSSDRSGISSHALIAGARRFLEVRTAASLFVEAELLCFAPELLLIAHH